MIPITDDLIARAEAAQHGVIQGPWELRDGFVYPLCIRFGLGSIREQDARFIAWARTGVPELVAELKAQSAEDDSPHPSQAQLNEDDAKDLQRIIDWIHANDMAAGWLAGEQPVDYIIRLLAALTAFRAAVWADRDAR